MEKNRLQKILLSFTDAVLTNEKALRDIKRDFELRKRNGFASPLRLDMLKRTIWN